MTRSSTALELARDESVERFRAWLGARGLPATPQRIAIARVVLGAEHPLSAEEAVERLRAAGPAPGTATVYRAIDMLMQAGLVVEEDRHEGFRRFRAQRDDVSTQALLCTSCGGVAELGDVVGATAATLNPAVAAAAEASGFVAVRHRLVVYGLCAACASAHGAANAGAAATHDASAREAR